MARTKLTDLYKSLNDKPLHEQEDLYKDLASVGKYDQGNEPLEIQYHGDQQLYYIEAEDIEAYVNGEDVEAIRPDAGFGEPDEVTANKQNSDVTDEGEKMLQEQGCSEQEIAEGTCGHGINGELGDEPAGPRLIDFFN